MLGMSANFWAHDNLLDCINVWSDPFPPSSSAYDSYYFNKDDWTIWSLDCGYPVYGCMDFSACNYNPDVTEDDGSCDFDICVGCTAVTACNYSDLATLNDGGCIFPEEGYNCDGYCYDLDNNGILLMKL